jgi:hypothetical protein
VSKTVELRYIEDPGHGWAEVPTTLAKSLGIGTDFTYRDDMLYLEEDAEMQILEDALHSKGYDWSYACHYVDDFDAWLDGTEWPNIPKEGRSDA